MRLVWIFLIVICTSAVLEAQPRFQTTFSFTMGFPQGEFGDNINDTGLGLTAGLNYRIGHSPVVIGGSFGFLQYGSVSRLAPIAPDIPELIVEVDTTNNILTTHFLVRYEFGRYESRINHTRKVLLAFIIFGHKQALTILTMTFLPRILTILQEVSAQEVEC